MEYDLYHAVHYGGVGVSPAPEAARMAALPGKARQVLAQTGKLYALLSQEWGAAIEI